MRTSTFLLSVFFAVACCHAAAPRPNIILIMCDDLGWGDVGFNGNQVIQTPHLDALAHAGMKLNRFYAAAPVCSPTRGSCLTGRHPYRYGVYSANRGHLKSEELTLAEMLKQHQYTTGHFGKWHLGTLTKTIRDSNRGGPKGAAHFSTPRQNGFDVSFSTEAKVPTHDPMLRPAKANSRWWNALDDNSNRVPYGTFYWDQQGERVHDNLSGANSRVIMDRVVRFVDDAAKAETPFFAVVWFHTPHLPVVAGPKHASLYADHEGYARNYYGCITAMDEQVGRLRDRLRQLAQLGNTMIWFCSDNGPEGKAGKAPGSAGPFRGRKRSLYEGGIRVPAFVHWPERVKPSATDVPCVTSDYLPTIADVLGIPLSQRPYDGVSLLRLMDGDMEMRDQPIGFQSGNQIALIADRFKLHTANSGKSWQLFDLIEDPGETDNIAPKRPTLVRRMVQTVEKWRKSCRNSDQEQDYDDDA